MGRKAGGAIPNTAVSAKGGSAAGGKRLSADPPDCLDVEYSNIF